MAHSALAAAALFALGLAMAWSELASGEPVQSDKSFLEYELLRTPQQKHGRTTIWLYVRPERESLSVSVRFHLCKGGEDLGRFPLQWLDQEKGRIPSERDQGRMLFRTECLAEEFVEESFLQLWIMDEQSGKVLPGVRVPLKSADLLQEPGKGL